MRDFEEIRNALGLKKFLVSPLGTLHFVPSRPDGPRIMVRRFDAELSPDFAAPFADLVRATEAWVERHPAVAALVRVETPIEVGRDFVARAHLTYSAHTRSYVESDDPPPVPAELETMRSAFRAASGTSADPRDALVEAVLARSLLEPTSKTVFDEGEGKFIVVEPKPTREEVERWASLMGTHTD